MKKILLGIFLGILALILVLFLGAYLYVRPIWSDYNLIMQAVKTSEDGAILAEGQIVLRGKLLTTRQQPSYLYFDEAELVDMVDLSTDKIAIDAHLYDILSGMGFGYSPVSGQLTSASIGDFVFTGHIYDTGYCVFKLKLPEGNVFVIGSSSTKPDWQTYLNQYLQDQAN